ncbi:MAG: Gfo/Idh/MocA family oxidoreductase [Acutalibacteraceae bacterium]|nr:Gfo/Idh/MocA family oxidoreductase [Acutalibacteraceae bacterium]
MLNFILTGFADEASKDLDGQIAALKRNGMSYFEPRGINGKNISDFTVEEAKELKAKLDAEGIKVSSIGSPFGKIEIDDDFEPHFEKFKNTVEVAKILETKYIRMFCFFFTKGQSFEDNRDEVLRRVKTLADYSAQHGVYCCLENEKDIYGDTDDRNLDVLRHCAPNLYAIVDPANYIQCGVDPLAAYEKVAGFVKYLHVKDAYFENGEVVPAGKGDGHVAEIIKRFARNSGEKFLSLEPHLTVFDGLENLEPDNGTINAIEKKKSYVYSNSDESFDAAVSALKEILDSLSKGSIRLGIIGCGNMGTSHMQNMLAGCMPEFELTAVADLKEARRQAALEMFPNVKVYNDGSELIASGEVDAVLVATPHYLHPTYAIEALNAGLHVMIEKPAGVYTKQVEEMNEVAAKSDKSFAIMFNQRTNPCYIKLREMLQGGQYGEIKRVNWIITDWYRTQSYYDSGDWRATWSGEGGGVLLNQCPHQLDLWQWLCGMPCKVRGFLHEGKWHNIEVEDDVTIYVDYPNGATGVFITTTGDYPGTNRLEITLDKAKIVCMNNKLEVIELAQSCQEFCDTAGEGFGRIDTTTYTITPDPAPWPQHVQVMTQFGDNILRGGELVGRGEEGINGLTISNCAHLSSWLDKTVELPIDKELYFKLLQEKIAGSKFVKVTKEVVQADMSSTFGN